MSALEAQSLEEDPDELEDPVESEDSEEDPVQVEEFDEFVGHELPEEEQELPFP